MRSHTMKRERVFTSLRRFTLHKSAPLHTTRNEAHNWLWEHSRRRPSGCWAANHAAPPCSRHRATPFRRRPARQTGEKAVSPLQGLQACMGGAMGKAHAREAGGQGTCCSGRVRVRMDRVHAWDCLEDGGTRVAALHTTRELASGARGGVAHREKSRGSAPAVEGSSCSARLRVQSRPNQPRGAYRKRTGGLPFDLRPPEAVLQSPEN